MELLEQAIGALRARRRADASVLVMTALGLVEQIRPPEERREGLREILALSTKAGFNDLAIATLVALVAADESLGDQPALVSHLLALGNAFTELDNLEDGGTYQQRALDISLARKDMADAASASTNLAVLAMRKEDFAGALPRLRASFGYLEGIDHPHTEFVTRAMFVQALDLLERDHEEALAAARPMFGRLRKFLQPEQVSAFAGVAERIAGRYLKTKPDVDAAGWKAQVLPELWGAGQGP